jgi:Arc/MetJ-type ribon-helix-helix transcriptional regulator
LRFGTEAELIAKLLKRKVKKTGKPWHRRIGATGKCPLSVSAATADFAYRENMTIELKPELERMIQERISSGQFKTVDDVLTQALAGLPRSGRSNRSAVPRMLEFSRRRSVKLPLGETVEGVVHKSRIHF